MDLVFLHGNHLPRCSATVDKRFDYHTLQLASGGVELFYGAQRFELAGAWLWSCQQGPRVRFHPWPPGGTWDHRYIACRGPLASRWQGDGLWPVDPERVESEDLAGLARAFDRLLEFLRRPDRIGRLRAINLLEGVLLERRERHPASDPRRPAWLDGVLAELARLDRQPDYLAIAARHGMALTTFRRQFRAATGQPAHAYRLGCLVGEARRLLGETDASIQSVADQLGYSDVYFFSRQFTRHTGISPGAYRRSRQA